MKSSRTLQVGNELDTFFSKGLWGRRKRSIQAKGMVIYILKHKLSPEGKVEGLTASECMRQTYLSHCALESALSNAQEVFGE